VELKIPQAKSGVGESGMSKQGCVEIIADKRCGLFIVENFAPHDVILLSLEIWLQGENSRYFLASVNPIYSLTPYD
jgi:hypothetical protein